MRESSRQGSTVPVHHVHHLRRRRRVPPSTDGRQLRCACARGLSLQPIEVVTLDEARCAYSTEPSV